MTRDEEELFRYQWWRRIRKRSNMRVKDVYFKLTGGGNSAGTDDTSPSGEQVFIVIGDSISVGQGDTVGPTPTAGTVKQWNLSSVINVSNADLYNANIGSPWPQFGINYNSRTGKKPVICSLGLSGATVYPNGDNNNYDVTGDRWTVLTTEVPQCLAAVGVIKPKAIIVSIGVNDARAATTIASVLAAYENFYDRLMVLYPGVPIYAIMFGSYLGTTATGRYLALRRKIVEISDDNADVHLVCQHDALDGWGLYKPDLIHVTQAGNNLIGAMIDRYDKDLAAGYDKHACSIFASFRNEISETKKLAISTFVASRKAAGTWDDIIMMHLFKGDTQDNSFIDWRFVLGPRFNSVTFSANNYIESSGGVGSDIDHRIIPTELVASAIGGITNIGYGVKVATVTTAGGVTACLFGAVNQTGSEFIALFQSVSNTLTYGVNQTGAGSSNSPDTAIADNAMYEIVRPDGSNVALYKNGVQSDTEAIATGATNVNRSIMSGGRNKDNAPDNRIQAQYQMFILYKNVASFDRVAFYNDLVTMLAAL